MKRRYIFIIVTFIALIFSLSSSAQKLPDKQTANLRVPANVKIDGKNTEWGQMKAYSKTTQLNYTVANDDKKLYLVMQTDVADVYNRMCNGGVKFVIQKNGSKSDEGAPFVKYPFFKEWSTFAFDFNMPRYSISFDGGIVQPGSLRMIEVPEKKITTTMQADSVMNLYNKRLRDNLKFIYTEGFTGVASKLPIYNDNGIEAAVAFDNKKVFTCEMAIDLQLLALTAKPGDKFSYHIVINGEPYKFNLSAPPGAIPNENTLRAIATTDFWGEYTLAK